MINGKSVVDFGTGDVAIRAGKDKRGYWALHLYELMSGGEIGEKVDPSDLGQPMVTLTFTDRKSVEAVIGSLESLRAVMPR